MKRWNGESAMELAEARGEFEREEHHTPTREERMEADPDYFREANE